MRRILPLMVALALALTGLAHADPPVHPSRVIVSTTLNDTLQFFDASSLEQTQPPLPSKGGAPVRLFVDRVGGHPFLFAADHGIEGGLGVFDVAGDLVTELPASPYPTMPGSVGVTAAPVSVDGAPPAETVFVTNTWQALGGCGLPDGSVSAFDASGLAGPAQTLTPLGTVDVDGAIPYAVATDGRRAYVSTNCGSTLDTIALHSSPLAPGAPATTQPANEASRATGRSPDGVMFDPLNDLIYVANIGGNSLSVFDAASPTARTTVPLPNAGPIDLTLADTPAGRHYVIASDGGADAVSLIDRDAIAACVSAGEATCGAEAARIGTGVPGGAPEGVAYDPVSDRIFAINKTVGAPSLSAIQLDESGGAPEGTPVATIPLQTAGAGTPLPAAIAFDVVVQTR